MPTRIYDASLIIKRRADRTISSSFLQRINAPNNMRSYGSPLGIYDNSIINSVRSGNMKEISRVLGCININDGCPCTSSYSNNISIPGEVTNISFTVGSIIVSWNPPSNALDSFTYIITPYLFGSSLPSVTTSNNYYRFTDLQEGMPYTFTVCAKNNEAVGPIVKSKSHFIAPPKSLSNIMYGNTEISIIEPSLKYIINTGLDTIMKHIAKNNLGPTIGSRFIYIWISSVVQAWNWIRPSSESRIDSIHDNWNWDINKSINHLSNPHSIIWISYVIDHITDVLTNSSYTSIYKCPPELINEVKMLGEWDTWLEKWNTWYSYRLNDGSIDASTKQPTMIDTSANMNNTLIIDGVTVNNISNYDFPSNWTPLTVQGKKQSYLTYDWDKVLSTCLDAETEETIYNSVTVLTGDERDAEIDRIIDITAKLTDEEKLIAEFWAGGPGTVSPPMMLIWMWKEYMRISDISCPNIMYSMLDLAIHIFEGSRVTWRLKTIYMEARPIQEIRRRYTGTIIPSWNGEIDGSQWIPYQEHNFVSPPFGDFPSGHSHFSKAFSLTMNKWFGNNINKRSMYYDNLYLISPLFLTQSMNNSSVFGDFIINPGVSLIEPSVVPHAPVVISFSTWDEIGEQAGVSRYYGGIHAETAHSGSVTVAELVDNSINSTWNIRIE